MWDSVHPSGYGHWQSEDPLRSRLSSRSPVTHVYCFAVQVNAVAPGSLGLDVNMDRGDQSWNATWSTAGWGLCIAWPEATPNGTADS